MRFIVVIFLLIPFQILFGQEIKKSIVKSGITKAGDNLFYYESDMSGNMIFMVNDGMNGPITMVYASEYDSLNRETKFYWVHSNLGFYLMENVYEKNCIKKYEYKSNSSDTFLYDREVLKEIKKRDDFIKMEVFYDLERGNKVLTSIENLDSAGNVTEKIYLSESGDTTTINNYRYNENNQEVFFHYEKIGDESWTWDIYFMYDERNNLIKSYRISSSNGIKDTTQVYNYIYNDENKLVSNNYYFENDFANKTDYHYNKKGQAIKELFYESSETKLDAKTIYKYDRNGNVKKKIQYDYRNPKNEQKEVYVTKLNYW